MSHTRNHGAQQCAGSRCLGAGEVSQVVKTDVGECDLVPGSRPLRSEVCVEQWAVAERPEHQRIGLLRIAIEIEVNDKAHRDHIVNRHGSHRSFRLRRADGRAHALDVVQRSRHTHLRPVEVDVISSLRMF